MIIQFNQKDVYSSKEKIAYLTFDDGPNNNVTLKVLDILKKENLITVNRTAGLNMVYINKRYSLKEIFEKYFERVFYQGNLL